MEMGKEEFKANRAEAPEESKESKKKYGKRLDSKLKEWTAQIEKLRAKAKVAEADLKVKYNQEIGSLQKRKEELQERLEALKKSSDETWEDLKAGTEKAVSELKQALKKAFFKFK